MSWNDGTYAFWKKRAKDGKTIIWSSKDYPIGTKLLDGRVVVIGRSSAKAFLSHQDVPGWFDPGFERGKNFYEVELL